MTQNFKENFLLIRDEITTCLQSIICIKNFWIYIPVILSFATTYTAYHLELSEILDKGNNEYLAVILISTVCIISLITAILSRFLFISSFFFLLGLNFLIRELDATKWQIPYIGDFKLRTKEYIYFALAVLAVWAFYKFVAIRRYFSENTSSRKLFLMMLITYVLSQLVARRVFKHIIPDERAIHIPLEEITENFAHSAFIIFALTLLITTILNLNTKKNS